VGLSSSLKRPKSRLFDGAQQRRDLAGHGFCSSGCKRPARRTFLSIAKEVFVSFACTVLSKDLTYELRSGTRVLRPDLQSIGNSRNPNTIKI
jgi:hypothetical protein